MESVRKRRLRYKGKHPRMFFEKYKELNPEKYAENLQKVLLRGQTPAGMHRSICVQEIITALGLLPAKRGVDATLGFGGHAQEILSRIVPNGKLYGLDVDPIELPKTEKRLRDLGFSEDNFEACPINFAGILSLLAKEPEGFDFVVADLGVSSMQIDNPLRGFSFKSEGPLDLRLNPNKGMSAAELLKSLDVKGLEKILSDNADEAEALRIAKSIKHSRIPVETTTGLAKVIHDSLKSVNPDVDKKRIQKTCQRVFQALRIAVNKEFIVLDEFLARAPRALKPGGTIAILSFHSGEDNRVAKSFQEGFDNGIYSSFSAEPIRPTREEKFHNSRSKSAKLRIATKTSCL